MRKTASELIELSRRFWSRRAGRLWSRDETRQAAGDVAGFFDCLERWSCAQSTADGLDAERKKRAP